MSENVTQEEFKEFKSHTGNKVSRLQEDLETYKDHLRTLDTNIQNHVIGCGLDAYKAEMRERCERLNERIKLNREQMNDHKTENEKAFTEIKEDYVGKIGILKGISNKIISTAIIFAVALIGVFGGINVNKVSQSEFNQHISVAAENNQKQVEVLDKFINSYS